MATVGSLFLSVIRLLVYVWGFHTNWIYSLISNPEMIKKKSKMRRSILTNPIQDFDTEATFLPCAWQRTHFIQMFEQGNIKTMADIWDWSLNRYWNKKLLGTREISTNKAEVLSYVNNV